MRMQEEVALERQRIERAQGLRRLQSDMDRMVLELMGADRMLGCPPHAFRPNMDVYYSKAAEAMIVELELAGVDPDSVRLEAHERVLRIRGQRVHRRQAEKVYQQMEIAYGPFERRVHLPLEIDAGEATAQSTRKASCASPCRSRLHVSRGASPSIKPAPTRRSSRAAPRRRSSRRPPRPRRSDVSEQTPSDDLFVAILADATEASDIADMAAALEVTSNAAQIAEENEGRSDEGDRTETPKSCPSYRSKRRWSSPTP